MSNRKKWLIAGLLAFFGYILTNIVVQFFVVLATDNSPKEAATRAFAYKTFLGQFVGRRLLMALLIAAGTFLAAFILIDPICNLLRRKTTIEKLLIKYRYNFSSAAWGEGLIQHKDKWIEWTNKEIPIVQQVVFLLASSERQPPVKVNPSNLDVPVDFREDIKKKLRIEFPDGSIVEFNDGDDLRFRPDMEVTKGIQPLAQDEIQNSTRALPEPVVAAQISERLRDDPSNPNWPFAETPKELINQMRGDPASFIGGIYELRKDNLIRTMDTFATPVAFKLLAKTDKYELRVGYLENEIIFNWGSDPDTLRIGEVPGVRRGDKGPFDGTHVHGKGRIPAGKWVEIVIIANLDSFEIWADRTQRFMGNADLSRCNEPFRVFQWGDSIIQVKSLLVGRPIGAIGTAAGHSVDQTTEPPPAISYPSPFAGEPTEWVGRMGTNYKSFKNGIYELDDEIDNEIITPHYFTAPVAFRVVAKTNSTNLRLSYVEEEIIFNWEQHIRERKLHIWRGPFAKRFRNEHFDKDGAGRITKGEWHVFDLVYRNDSFSISVDGFPVLSEKADFSDSRSQFSVFAGALATVHVASVQSGEPKSDA